MKKYLYILILIFLTSLKIEAQTDSIYYKKFYYDSGKISSEGFIENGKPNKYWKTYYPNGNLKSEGNRENFKLDSTWKFYKPDGELKLVINYKQGLKHGLRITYLPDKTLEENFEEDKKHGESRIYYENDSLWKVIPFENGLQEGKAYEYARDGRIITITHYKNGFINRTEYINRKDQQGRKHGTWKYYYPNGNIKRIENYTFGVKSGYFKYFNLEGNLKKVEKYYNGQIEEDPPELAELDIKKEYYPDGSIKAMGSYKDGVAEGVTRYYTEDGEIEKAFVFKNGRIIGKGIVDKLGEKQGKWKEYYDFGVLKAEGEYLNDKRIGLWKYYHPNKKLEQIGKFNRKGESVGEWKWYYPDGSIRKEEVFIKGVLDGPYVEYFRDSTILMQGEYFNGSREGFWTISVHGYKQEGEYLEGMRTGTWKHYYPDGQLAFKGSYVDGIPDSKHIWYHKNGKRKKQGSYIVGMREGTWNYYNYEGQLILTIRYENGIEKEYNAVRITPELELEDL